MSQKNAEKLVSEFVKAGQIRRKDGERIVQRLVEVKKDERKGSLGSGERGSPARCRPPELAKSSRCRLPHFVGPLSGGALGARSTWDVSPAPSSRESPLPGASRCGGARHARSCLCRRFCSR